MEKISAFLKEFWWIGLLAIVGVGILGYGVWEAIKPGEVKVEILKSQIQNSQTRLPDGQVLKSDDKEQAQIVVDVAGAVEKPGVYKLPSGSRIGDALVVAGGLGEKADREWVAKTINLAEVVKDGGKIYIPAIQIIGGSVNPSISEPVGQKSGKVNINTASMGELDALAGIGEVRAKAIVDNRPYAASEEIVAKAKVPQSVYEAIKDSLSIY